MYKKLLVLFLVSLPLISIACSKGQLTEETIKNVVRVFWHENSRYSVMIQEPDSKLISTVNFPVCRDVNISIIEDVPGNEAMWVRVIIRSGAYYSYDPCFELLEIHIRSEKDIEGASWNHGKFGSGRTHVIR